MDPDQFLAWHERHRRRRTFRRRIDWAVVTLFLFLAASTLLVLGLVWRVAG
jgi:hypothetical protein